KSTANANASAVNPSAQGLPPPPSSSSSSSSDPKPTVASTSSQGLPPPPIDPLEKWEKMKSLGMATDKIVEKMKAQGVEKCWVSPHSSYFALLFSVIKEFETKHASATSAPTVVDQKANNNDDEFKRYDKYRRMIQMKMPMPSIANKMKMDGFKPDQIDAFMKDPDNAGKVVANTNVNANANVNVNAN
ncbi:hypothetical protein RFI_22494, partial [Reticulomyxa filosa]